MDLSKWDSGERRIKSPGVSDCHTSIEVRLENDSRNAFLLNSLAHAFTGRGAKECFGRPNRFERC